MTKDVVKKEVKKKDSMVVKKIKDNIGNLLKGATSKTVWTLGGVSSLALFSSLTPLKLAIVGVVACVYILKEGLIKKIK